MITIPALTVPPSGADSAPVPMAGAFLDPDAELERRIDHQYLLVWYGKTPEVRRDACNELARLVAQRSPRRVEQMERERGLR